MVQDGAGAPTLTAIHPHRGSWRRSQVRRISARNCPSLLHFIWISRWLVEATFGIIMENSSLGSDENQLDIYNAHEDAFEATEWKRKKAELQHYENAAKKVHKVRITARLITSRPAPLWDDMDISSQRHLIADAETVAKNPSITEPELRKLYWERLATWGDTDNPDLGVSDESSEIIEGMVLEHLKSALNK